MTYCLIDERDNAYLMPTSRRKVHEAFCDFMEEHVIAPVEVRRHFIAREPLEVTAEMLMGTCREVFRY